MEIGIDGVEISRFDGTRLSNKNFLNKIFTVDEIKYCKDKDYPPQHFAVRFAGKEAIIKILSKYNIQIPLNQIEILNDKKGIPFARIINEDYNHIKIKISLSHFADTAMAIAASP